MNPPPRPTRPSRLARHRDPARGAILIVAMLIAVVIAISLGSYIALGRNSLRLANRSF